MAAVHCWFTHVIDLLFYTSLSLASFRATCLLPSVLANCPSVLCPLSIVCRACEVKKPLQILPYSCCGRSADSADNRSMINKKETLNVVVVLANDISKSHASSGTRLFYTVSQKNKGTCFCHNFVKFPPTLVIFDAKIANSLKLYEMHSFPTPPNTR